MPKILKWSQTLSKSYSEWSRSDLFINLVFARFLKCVWPFWSIRHYSVKISSLFEGCKKIDTKEREHEMWNICTNGKTCGILENVLISFKPI